jgi:hypothetical protein
MQLIGLLLLVSTQWVMAATHNGAMRGSNSFWLCKAYDESNKQWLAKNSYQRLAINHAYLACKKQSATPNSCKTATEYCEPYINGVSSSPKWRCTALDHRAQPWVSDSHRNRDDAAIGAKAYCEQNSGTPDACYVNLLTCKNMNAHSW